MNSFGQIKKKSAALLSVDVCCVLTVAELDGIDWTPAHTKNRIIMFYPQQPSTLTFTFTLLTFFSPLLDTFVNFSGNKTWILMLKSDVFR